MSQITRRAVLAAGALNAALVGRGQADPLGWPIGVQLWAVKAELDADFDGALRRLASIGYRQVEAAAYHGRSAEAFRSAVGRAGLVCDSTHVTMADLQKDGAGQIGYARDLGVSWLVCSSPSASGVVAPARPGEDWMDQMRRAMTLDDWRRNAELMNQLGSRTKTAGLKLAYHSHAFEFARYDGVTAFDELQRLTDPALVWTELDVGWAVAGGRDPVQLLRRYRDRIRLLHLKDLKTRPELGRMADYTTVPVGSGVIDWPPILAEARRIGVARAYVEQEPPFTRPVFEELARSYAYLHGL